MATTCLKRSLSSSIVPSQQPSWRSQFSYQICQALPNISNKVKRSWFSVSAARRDLRPSDSNAGNVVEKALRRCNAHPAFPAALGADLLLVNSAGALEESDAIRAYDAFVKGTSSTAEAVASDGGDVLANAFTGVTAASGDNAVVIGAIVVFAVAVPALVSVLFQKGFAGEVSGKEALQSLEEDSESILIDIRPRTEISEEGSPKLVGKKAIRVQYQTESDGTISADPAFVSKVESKCSSEDATIYVIDKSGKTSIEAAKSLTQAGFPKVHVIKGGTEAWLASELPWLKPTNFTLDLATLREAIDATVNENPNVIPTTLGIAAATAGSFLLFSEAEIALQLLGSAAVVQLFVKKLLFAEDRKKTIEQVKAFLDTKVAPQELVDEIKEIGDALLPMESASGASSTPSSAPTEPNSRAASPEVENGKSATDGAIESTELPPSPTALSPYAAYPELKPPASPTSTKP